MWKIAAIVMALSGMMSINDEPPSDSEVSYIEEVMPYSVMRVNKVIDTNEVQFEIQMFRGTLPVGVTVTLYTPYSWEMFKHAVEQAAIAVSVPHAVHP